MVPGWVWFVVGLVVAAQVLLWDSRRRRKQTVAEFRDYLARTHPEIEQVGAQDKQLILRPPGGGLLPLSTQALRMGAIRAGALQGRQMLYAKIAAEILAGGKPTIGPSDLPRLRPRLVTREKLADLAAKAPLPSREVPGLPLSVVYVLESSDFVLYVTREMMKLLALDDAGLDRRALDNLSASFPRAIVRDALEKRALAVVKTMDGHDAARLLLVPTALEPGEAVATAIPDGNTLAVIGLPDGDDWSGIEKLARTTDGSPALLDRPIRVTREGFTLA
jgi:hypothetical protein